MNGRLGAVLGFGFVSLVSSAAHAGGLTLPGSGAVSTSRAGAAIVSADDGEALSLNPAGLANVKGTVVTVSAAIISYSMSFSRTGTYDALEAADTSYEGTPYPTVENDASAPLGFGSFQPVPVIAVVTDLGGRLGKLRLAAGLYAPNAYPFRDMTNGYEFNGPNPNAPPPSSRYDIYEQEGAIIMPSIAAAYRVLPQLDVGARFSYGFAHVKSTVALWTGTQYDEDVGKDVLFSADAKGTFPTFGLGLTYRINKAISVAAAYNYALVIHAKGDATAVNGPRVGIPEPIKIGPLSPGTPPRCAAGSTFDSQKVCVDFQVPMSATVGARYQFLDKNDQPRGDIELNIGWENWGKRCAGAPNATNADFEDPSCTSPGVYRVVVDGEPYLDIDQDGTFESPVGNLQTSFLDHRLKDVWTARLGGSYILPAGENSVTLRGGVGYDSRAAEEGWLRADIDGMARVTTTVGAAYTTKRFQINVGIGAIFEGSATNEGNCNPTSAAEGCAGTDEDQPLDDRSGPDPINPLNEPFNQAENPVTQGTFKSHYLLGMLGASFWF